MHSARRTLGVLLACLMWAGAPAVLAQVADPPEVAPATQPAGVDQLLAELSAEDWQTRQRAAEALAQLGTEHLPRLRQLADSTTDPDVRTAIVAAMRRMEETAAASATPLTLDFKDAPAVDVLNAIGKQVSYSIVADSTEWLKDVKVSIDAKDQPFWEVMKQLSAQWPVRPSQQANDPTRIALTNTGQNFLSPRAAVAGPFVICPVMLNSNATIDLLADKPQARFRSMHLQVMVLAEPKVRASRITLTIKTAVDENGKSLLTGNGMSTVQPTGNIGQMASIPLRVQAAAGEIGKTIIRMTGSIKARVPSRLRYVELDDALNLSNRQIDLSGRQVKVNVRPHDDVYEVKLQTPNRGGAMDEATTNVYRALSVVDAEGQALYRRSFAQTMVQPNNWEYTLTFARDGSAFGQQNRKTGEPAKLIWDLPVETKDLDVEFVLTDIPLVSH
jgi:hypothetical protein